MNITDRLMEKIRALLDEAGIDRAVMLVDDPDDDTIHHHARGSTCWKIGAAAMIGERAREAMKYVPDDQDDL